MMLGTTVRVEELETKLTPVESVTVTEIENCPVAVGVQLNEA